MADETTTTTRRCIGSARFGIEPHEAPISDFPAQPSQKDELGRMCRAHWNQYTAGLARDAKAHKVTAAIENEATERPEPVAPNAAPTPGKRRARKDAEPALETHGDAG